MEDVLDVRRHAWELQTLDAVNPGGVFGGDLDSAGVQRFELAQLNEADRGLHFGHAVVEADVVKFEMPISFAHGLSFFIDGKIFALGVIRAAAERAMGEHALEKIL